MDLESELDKCKRDLRYKEAENLNLTAKIMAHSAGISCLKNRLAMQTTFAEDHMARSVKFKKAFKPWKLAALIAISLCVIFIFTSARLYFLLNLGEL